MGGSGGTATAGCSLALAVALAACSRGGHGTVAGDVSGGADGGPPPPEGGVAAAPTGAPAPPRPAPALPASEGEASRDTFARLEDDPLLQSHLAVLRAHFGAETRGPFEVQRVDLAGGAKALLVALRNDAQPLVLVVDRDRLLWAKERPVAGITPPVKHLALAPRPDGGVAVFGWVEALGLVMARMWADDSYPFGDFEVFYPAACDSLSAAHAMGFGWVVVCGTRGGARAARMREDGTEALARSGLPVGATSAVGPVSLAFDTPETFVLVQRAAAVGGERVLAFRYDAQGNDLWRNPLELPGLGLARDTEERIALKSLEDGGARAEPLRGRAIRGKPCVIHSDGSAGPAE
jgi:hypothetical protein